MIPEEKVMVLSQLIESMREAVLDLENAIASKNNFRINQAKEHISKLNNEIKENLIN